MNATKPLFAALAAMSSLMALASAEIVGGVLTFDVEEGKSETCSDISSTITKIVKNGKGTVVIPNATNFGRDKQVEINAGIIECRAYDALGSYNTFTIADKAQLYINFDYAGGAYSPWPHTFRIVGSGPDGTGAIRSRNASDNQSFYRNPIELMGDATIGVYGGQAGFGNGCALTLNKHTLTMVGSGGAFFNSGFTVDSGHIVLDVTRSTSVVFQGSALFKGDSESTLTIRQGKVIQFWSFQPNPLPWTVVIPQASTIELGECLVNGSYSTNCNVVSGPVQYKGTLTIRGMSGKTNPGRCMTFAGPVSNIGDDKSYISFGDHNPQVYFRHQNTFHGVSIGASARATAHGMADGALPSIANPTHYLSLHGSDADRGEADIWLGDGLCTAAWASKAIASPDSWNGYASSAKLALRTVGDFTFDADIPEPDSDGTVDRIQNVALTHTGTGALTFTGAFPNGSKKLHFVQREDNTTVFGAPEGQTLERQLLGLHVCSGAVEVANGARLYTPTTGNGHFVGGYSSALVNDTGVPAKLVVRDGGSIVTPIQENTKATSSIRVGSLGRTPAVLEIHEGGAVTNNLQGAYAVGEKSAIRQFGGEAFTLSIDGNDGYFAREGCGFYGLFGGSFSNRLFLTLGGIPHDETGAARGRGMFLQTGGTAWFCGSSVDGSSPSAMVTRGGEGEYLMTGGTLRGAGCFEIAGQQYGKADAPNATGVFSMHGDGNPVVDFNGDFYITRRESGVSAMLNLNAGVFSARRIYSYWCVAGKAGVNESINFNGGTYRLREGDEPYITYLDWRPYKVVVYGKGATFDVADDKDYWLSDRGGTADQQLVFANATGKGLRSVRIPSNMPRTGYSGIMPCKVVGGSGTCASVALDYDPATGTIAEELLITCPGCDYTDAPKVIAYGPDFTTAYECEVVLTDAPQEEEPGTVYKTGPGRFAINVVNNTFAGTYVISNGTLKIPANQAISMRASVFLAGGHFWYDWRSRTIKSLGGWGGFYGYKNDNGTYRLSVTDSLVFDVADLQAGKFLEMESDVGEKQAVAKDNLYLEAGCKVRLLHPELLPENKASYTLLKVNVPLNRVPELEGKETFGDGRWRVYLTNGGKTLKLGHSDGSYIFIR